MIVLQFRAPLLIIKHQQRPDMNQNFQKSIMTFLSQSSIHKGLQSRLQIRSVINDKKKKNCTGQRQEQHGTGCIFIDMKPTQSFQFVSSCFKRDSQSELKGLNLQKLGFCQSFNANRYASIAEDIFTIDQKHFIHHSMAAVNSVKGYSLG